MYIPRFCWHERMKPVGMCRMCLVEVEGVRGFPPACTTPVAEGMVCNTQSDAVKKIQDGVLEFLLVNHPLDCPVCDRGGECPLQDQTLAFGPGESRFIEEKRHFEKPIELSDLILLDRERCIQCGRCTRFAEEIAGDPLIDFVDRGDRMQVLNFAEQPFDSYFSGNTVQICPVGALTARQYRFKARPWDLETVETSCNACAVQCRGALQSSSNRLVRLLGVDSEPVNHGWLCDKGRYGIEWVHSERRVLEPQRRVERRAPRRCRGRMRSRSRPRCCSTRSSARARVDRAARRRARHQRGRLRVRAPDEGRDRHRQRRRADRRRPPGRGRVGLSRAPQIADCDRASAIVLLGPDLEEELPVLHLRLRRAAVELGVPLVDLAAVVARAHRVRDRRRPLGARRGARSRRARLHQRRARRSLRAGRRRARSFVARRVECGRDARREGAPRRYPTSCSSPRCVAATCTARSTPVSSPASCPGGCRSTPAATGSTRRGEAEVPRAKGLDARGILEASAAGKIEVLVIFGCDPIADFPDVELARRGIAGAKKIIAVGAFLTQTSAPAEVVLPCTLWGEKTGSVTNLEGRVQRVGRKVAPEGAAMDDWRIASELAVRLGSDFDFATVDEVTDELARVAPAHAGVDAALLRARPRRRGAAAGGPP